MVDLRKSTQLIRYLWFMDDCLRSSSPSFTTCSAPFVNFFLPALSRRSEHLLRLPQQFCARVCSSISVTREQKKVERAKSELRWWNTNQRELNIFKNAVIKWILPLKLIRNGSRNTIQIDFVEDKLKSNMQRHRMSESIGRDAHKRPDVSKSNPLALPRFSHIRLAHSIVISFRAETVSIDDAREKPIDICSANRRDDIDVIPRRNRFQKTLLFHFPIGSTVLTDSVLFVSVCAEQSSMCRCCRHWQFYYWSNAPTLQLSVTFRSSGLICFHWTFAISKRNDSRALKQHQNMTKNNNRMRYRWQVAVLAAGLPLSIFVPLHFSLLRWSSI